MRRLLTLLLIVGVCFFPLLARSQGELAATLEVLEAGVEVQRVNTTNWITVNVEAIVGVGDLIRTNETGRARITFFADGVDTDLLPLTTYRIQQFSGDDTTFTIEAEVIAGQTLQRLARLLNAGSSYDINTPGMSLAARGTQFAIRVEDNGRSAMLVSEGTVAAANDGADASVPTGFGIRADDQLSDVVAATTFDALDAALDGCTASVSTPDDLSINVRIGASTDFPRIGTIAASDVTLFMGRTQSGAWYRINYRGGFGWILASDAELVGGCAGLRLFPDQYGPEDPTLYESVGDPVDLSDLPQPSADSAPEATPEVAPGQ
ncbi:MAG: FecR domain-containing protein [Anaerolinea sp.]|nr:FecR domain-containing protein [Anaerolinea sp.]